MPGMPGCFWGSLAGPSHDPFEGLPRVALDTGGLPVEPSAVGVWSASFAWRGFLLCSCGIAVAPASMAVKVLAGAAGLPTVRVVRCRAHAFPLRLWSAGLGLGLVPDPGLPVLSVLVIIPLPRGRGLHAAGAISSVIPVKRLSGTNNAGPDIPRHSSFTSPSRL